jgi:hypothetical protein
LQLAASIVGDVVPTGPATTYPLQVQEFPDVELPLPVVPPIAIISLIFTLKFVNAVDMSIDRWYMIAR